VLQELEVLEVRVQPVAQVAALELAALKLELEPSSQKSQAPSFHHADW
jgi:hypothetical protein